MLNFLGISAQIEVHDSLRASLLTCTPGLDAYAHFGHTALRIFDITTNKDFVFNYGCFDSTQGDFIIKFIKGETDYVVEAENGDFFTYRYDMMGNGVTEQVINLTQPEAHKLFDLLKENLRPENRGYRYSWLYDNCTTRARDMINRSIEGEVVYTNRVKDITARQELHECLANDAWLKLGIDLLLGTEIDTIAPRRVQQFIPAYYQADLDSAIIKSADGTERPMISNTYDILKEKNDRTEDKAPVSPISVFNMVLLFAVVLSVKDFRTHILSYWFDVILLIAQGCAGIIISYLYFFSLHPAVDSNLQVIIFNPLAFIFAIAIIYCHAKRKENYLNYVNLALIIVFLCFALCKQSINYSVIAMAFTLLIRALVNVHLSNIVKIYRTNSDKR